MQVTTVVLLIFLNDDTSQFYLALNTMYKQVCPITEYKSVFFPHTVSDEVLQKNLKQMEKQLNQLDIDLKNISKMSLEEGDRFPDVMNISFLLESKHFNVLIRIFIQCDVGIQIVLAFI